MIKVFLGGTCNNSNWREKLISLLEPTVNYFDPRVKDWDEEAQQKELEERRTCDFCLYVITPEMTGVYSIAEVIDDSNKRPQKTLFCYLPEGRYKKFTKGQLRSLYNVKKMVDRNGGNTFDSLQEIANFLNNI